MAADVYDVAGFRMLGAADDPEALRGLRQVLSGFGPLASNPTNSPANGLPLFELTAHGDMWHIVRDGRTLQVDPLLAGALGACEWHIVSAALEYRRDLFHLHGAALAVPGKDAALVVIGASGSGKTTLTLALMNHGFVPFADDVVLMHPEQFLVEPLRRAFHVGHDAARLLGALPLTKAPADVPLPAGWRWPATWSEAARRAAWILALDGRPGGRPVVASMSQAEAAAVILQHTSTLASSSRLALHTAARLTAKARCYRMTAGTPAATVEAVKKMVGMAGFEPTTP